MSERVIASPPQMVAAGVEGPVQPAGAHDRPPEPGHSTLEEEREGAPAGRPVLIVEDEPGLADVLAVHLEAAGYAPIVARDGLEALYALDRVTPQAVLLDLHLPQVSGFRLIQLLKQRPDMPRVPVIVLTALSFQEAEEAVRAGADDFITKPFLPAEVVTRVDRLLERLA
ncbi:MAG: response regulator transcription factor [Chloroflexota bacterium]